MQIGTTLQKKTGKKENKFRTIHTVEQHYSGHFFIKLTLQMIAVLRHKH